MEKTTEILEDIDTGRDLIEIQDKFLSDEQLKLKDAALKAIDRFRESFV